MSFSDELKSELYLSPVRRFVQWCRTNEIESDTLYWEDEVGETRLHDLVAEWVNSSDATAQDFDLVTEYWSHCEIDIDTDY